MVSSTLRALLQPCGVFGHGDPTVIVRIGALWRQQHLVVFAFRKFLVFVFVVPSDDAGGIGNDLFIELFDAKTDP